jgi:predicted amidohydrolase YtcJ
MNVSETSLVILNANVITLNPKQPRARAIAVRNGKIVAIGSSNGIRKYINAETKVIDARRRTIVPGLVDCHAHMTGFGQFLQTLNLRDVGSISEMQRKLREYAQKNPEKTWILGGRWDNERCSEKRYPTRWDLDEAVPDKPVLLIRVCGHVGVANSKALELAGISKRTQVDGGKVDLDDVTSEPTGILREDALGLIWKIVPKPTEEELEKTCLLACRTAVEAGLTGVHWILGSMNEIVILLKLFSEDKLPLRVYSGIPVNFLDKLIDLGFTTCFGNDMIKIGFVKILADGSLGGHTAALTQPYSDRPDTSGIMLHTQRKLNRLVLKAHRAQLQLAIHAIGDHAMEVVLKAYEKALTRFPRENHRHRIEHCSVLNPELIKRMKRSNLIASVQPHFIVSDFWAIDRVGKKRARWVYPFETLLKRGLIVASGSDCPVENISPILGIWAATTRKTFPGENLTAEEALTTYTVNAAYASFDEDKRGTIQVGKFADLTILSDDVLAVSPEKVKDITVEMTIVAGKVVYATKSFKHVL